MPRYRITAIVTGYGSCEFDSESEEKALKYAQNCMDISNLDFFEFEDFDIEEVKEEVRLKKR